GGAAGRAWLRGLRVPAADGVLHGGGRLGGGAPSGVAGADRPAPSRRPGRLLRRTRQGRGGLQGVKDRKGAGWQWPQPRMPDPARAARVWVVLAVATRWALSVGGAAPSQVAWQRASEHPAHVCSAASVGGAHPGDRRRRTRTRSYRSVHSRAEAHGLPPENLPLKGGSPLDSGLRFGPLFRPLFGQQARARCEEPLLICQAVSQAVSHAVSQRVYWGRRGRRARGAGRWHGAWRAPPGGHSGRWWRDRRARPGAAPWPG